MNKKINAAKLNAAKKIAAKKNEVAPDYLEQFEGLYNRLDKLYEALNNQDVAKSAEIDELNNTIVKLMNDMLVKGVKIDNLGEIKGVTEVSVKNLKDIKLPNTTLKVPDKFKVSNLDWLASDESIKEVNKNLADIADQLGELKPEDPGQRPEDFVPFRRVYKNGNRLMFDDSTWGKAGGGGTTFDTTGLATEAKQDDIITAVEGSSKATGAYSISAISDDGTYKYFWFEDASLNYYIMRKTKATSVFLYTKGTGGYATVYQSSILGPSGSPTFASYGNTF